MADHDGSPPLLPRVDQARLDFLRGAAATYVVINHSRGSFYAGGEKILAGPHSLFDKAAGTLLQLTSLGAEAAVLFFVLSGFAMAHSVARSRGAAGFYLRRLIRIWPPYIAATLFAVAVGRLVGIDAVERNLVRVLFYINPGVALVPQYWSLPFEVFFYLLCPLILASRRAVEMVAAIALVLTAVCVAFFGIGLNPTRHFLSDFFGNELLLFAFGAIAYFHLDRIPALSGRALAAAATLLFLVAWAIKFRVGTSNLLSNLAMVSLALLAIRNLPDRLAAFRPLNWGFFSYSIYIFHYALIEVAHWGFRRAFGYEPLAIRNPFAWMLVVPTVIATCFLLYQVSERPSNAILARLRRRGASVVSDLTLAPPAAIPPE